MNNLPPEKREWLEKRNQPNYWYRGVSDSFIITVPCFDDVALFGKHVGDIYSCLYGISVLSLWALTNKKPLRGGVDIALGTEIDQKEVYGPVIVRAYDIESREAKYPRVVVGKGLLGHLDKVQKECKDDLNSRHTLLNIDNCKKLITIDADKKTVLDFMGKGLKSVSLDGIEDLVRCAYNSIISQEKWFLESGDDKLRGYYSKLREYCESRLSLWGIEPCKK